MRSTKLNARSVWAMTKFQQGCGYLQQDINMVRALRDEQRLRAYWTKVAFACAAYAVFVGVVL